VDTDEFLRGVETACKGKSYQDLPAAFKFFIEAQFRTIDVDGKRAFDLDGAFIRRTIFSPSRWCVCSFIFPLPPNL
jgi:hypothetical protein